MGTVQKNQFFSGFSKSSCSADFKNEAQTSKVFGEIVIVMTCFKV